MTFPFFNHGSQSPSTRSIAALVAENIISRALSAVSSTADSAGPTPGSECANANRDRDSAPAAENAVLASVMLSPSARLVASDAAMIFPAVAIPFRGIAPSTNPMVLPTASASPALSGWVAALEIPLTLAPKTADPARVPAPAMGSAAIAPPDARTATGVAKPMMRLVHSWHSVVSIRSATLWA